MPCAVIEVQDLTTQRLSILSYHNNFGHCSINNLQVSLRFQLQQDCNVYNLISNALFSHCSIEQDDCLVADLRRLWLKVIASISGVFACLP